MGKVNRRPNELLKISTFQILEILTINDNNNENNYNNYYYINPDPKLNKLRIIIYCEASAKTAQHSKSTRTG